METLEINSSYRSFFINYVIAALIAVLIILLMQRGIFFLAFRLASALDFAVLILDYALLALLGFMLEEPVIQRIYTRYILTNQEVQEIKGIIRKTKTVIPFSSISDVKMNKGIIGRLLNFGNIEVHSIRGEKIVLKGIHNPEKVFNLITSNIQR